MVLDRKIDFSAILIVRNANPNGDPLNGNRPRLNFDGTGELSDVCIKRKIRNRLMHMGKNVFVQSDDSKVDGYPSLRKRAEGEIPAGVQKNVKEFRKATCEKWIDVRAFGQVFAYSKKDKDTDDAVSIGIRGPVSIHPAISINPINITSLQITKSVSGEGDGTRRASDTMGMKHRVEFGMYVLYGSMNPQLAEGTGFSYEDALDIKEALRSLFVNNASSARPEGSMEVYKLYWWEHNCKNGQYSSAKVHRSLQIKSKSTEDVKSIEDFEIGLIGLPNLEPEILSGE